MPKPRPNGQYFFHSKLSVILGANKEELPLSEHSRRWTLHASPLGPRPLDASLKHTGSAAERDEGHKSSCVVP